MLTRLSPLLLLFLMAHGGSGPAGAAPGGAPAEAAPAQEAPAQEAPAQPALAPRLQQPPPRAIPPLQVPAAWPSPRPSRAADTLPLLLPVVLSEGTASAVPSPAPARVLPLSDVRIEELLARLPTEVDAAGGSRPAGEGSGAEGPGRGGAEGGGSEPAPAAPLQVLSVLPGGETELALGVTVVFSEPMVSLGTDGEALAGAPPVDLTPEPPGSWRWLDVRTLRFEPDEGRLPGATAYRVHVPRAVRAASGSRPEADFEAEFRTAGARVLGGYPNALGGPGEGLASPEPTLLLLFDQDVDPGAVLASARLEVDSASVPLRLAGMADLEHEEGGVAEAAREAGQGRWVALRPVRPLSAGGEAVLRLDPGLPSREGPRSAGRSQELRFKVAGPFEMLDNPCGIEEERCAADGRWGIRFSHPLDTAQVVADLVDVVPDVPDLRVAARGDIMILAGDFRPHTTYHLELDPALRDRFGTALGPGASLPGHMGAPTPFLQIPGGPFLTLDPSSAGQVELRVRAVPEIEVVLHRVRPDEWPAFQDNLESRRHPEREPWTPDRPPAARMTLRPEDGGRGWSRLDVDLKDVLEEGGGHVLLVARIPSDEADPLEPVPPGVPDRRHAAAWIQVASFAVGAASNPEELVAWALSLVDRTPLEGVRVQLSGGGTAATTDASGLARMPLEPRPDSLLVARWRDEVVLLPAMEASRSRWEGDPSFPAPRWFTVSDRGLYQSGEEMVIHGWMRERSSDRPWEMAFPERVDSLGYQLRSSRGAQIAEGVVPVSSPGTFGVTTRLPADVSSGLATLELEPFSDGEKVPRWRHRQSIRVEQFRRPEYEVSAEVDPGPHVVGEVLRATASATYYDGAPLAGAPVTWRVRSTIGQWAPPGWRGWRFGAPGSATSGRSWSPRWTSLTSTTDGQGRHTLRVGTDTLPIPSPIHVRVEAEVRDVDRQAGSAGGATTVHPAAVAAALRADRHWARAGDEVVVDAAVVDLEGAHRPDLPLRVEAELEPDPRRPDRGEPLAVPMICAPGPEETIDGASVRALRCRGTLPTHGTLRVEAEARDDRGRRSLTRLRLPVFPRPGALAGHRSGERLELLPDRELYRPGDTARVALDLPAYPMEGLLMVTRHGLREVRPIRVEGPGHVESIPIDRRDAGSLLLRLHLDPANGGMEAVFATASLRVESEQRRLRVEVRPERDRVAPGDSVVLDVHVEGALGSAAGGDVTLWVVDEAVLSLGGYDLPDPLGPFLRPDYRAMPAVFLPHGTVRWPRRSLGEGVVSAEVVDAATGRPENGLVARLGGDREVRVGRGTLVMRDVPPGRHPLTLLRGDEVVLEREVEVPAEGVDLGVLDVRTARAGGGLPGEEGEELELAATRLRGASSDEMARTAEMRIDRIARTRQEPPLPKDASTVQLRRFFQALAAFEAGVALDGDGRAQVRVRLPDTMTRYRVFAVATHGATRFGTGDAWVTASRDLVVRAMPPRALRPDDAPELPVTIQNASDRAMEVDVVARTRGLTLEGGRGFHVALPAGARTELRLPARATEPGDATLDVLAVAPGAGDAGAGEAGSPVATETLDAVQVPVPIRPALAPRSVAFHRSVEAGQEVRLPLRTPPRARAGYGTVDVGLSASRLQPLVDVIRALCIQPLFLPEATTARVLGLAGLGEALDVLRAADLMEPAELRDLVRSDVDRLEGWLRSYVYGGRRGGTPGGDPSPLSRIHAAHALEVAGEAGFAVSDRSRSWLGRVAQGVWEEERARLASGPAVRAGWQWATAAYALHVGVRAGSIQVTPGSPGARWMEGLEPADLPVEVLAWLLAPASASGEDAPLRNAFLQELENRAITTTGTVTFRQGARDVAGSPDLHVRRLVHASDRRSDAVALAVLADEAPDHPLIAGLVRGLLGHRDGSAAGSAHENGWVLLALGRYAATRDEGTTAINARVGLAGGAAPRELRVRAGAPASAATLPLPAPGESATLEVETAGTGTSYLRAAVLYSPDVTPDLPAEERGFFVSRRYEAVDDPDDVRLDAEGTWRIRAGARVRVRLTFTAPARRYQVELRDPLPGGLEAVNPGLRGTGFTDDPAARTGADVPVGRVTSPLAVTPWNAPFGWEWTDLLFRWRAHLYGWAAHQELRDDGMDAYTPYLPAGTYETTYLVRATLPGSFLAPPARIEEGDHPETFGQGVPDRIVVEVR